MKNIYEQEINILSERHGRYDGLKSLIYFILMMVLIFSMLFLPDKINAGDIQFGAQITNKAEGFGTLSGRFLKDFNSSDLYIIGFSSSETFDKDKIFSLIPLNNDPEKLVWKNQISIFSAYDCIKAGGWGSLSSIDFKPLQNQTTGDIPEIIVAILLVKNGGDPLNPSDWIDVAVTSLVTDLSERVPGQTQFLSSKINNRYYPVDAENGNVEPPQDADKDNSDSDVEKPDIYKVDGNRLFYANGSAARFQVVDISKPDAPKLIHSESLQNTPLDLYISDNYVMLLEQMNEQNSTSVVLKVFHVQGDIITKVSEQVYPNFQYAASRRSGDRIFITGTVPYYYPYAADLKSDNSVTDESSINNLLKADEVVEQGSLVAAIDIANPASPALISKKNLEGYDSDIYLNSDYLVHIARVSWETTILYLFDLNQSDPLTQIDEIKIGGRVPSEYHVNISGSTLFAIYRDQDISSGSSLKIFEINKDASAKVSVEEKGSVNGIAPKEDLFAATFIDDRAYIVTYERKDPLWVVDTSDHSAPKIIGELEVPGWSEYIRFHKNRLVALGYDDSNDKRLVSIALFSVEDPLKPVLLDRVTPLSGVADYTHSVAIEDDRGFYWNTLSNLIMVPISYYTDANYSGVEIIHVDSGWNSFIRKDFVSATFNVQRAAETDDSNSSSDNLADIALSMGDAALNTINISPTEKPSILGELRLAYNVEKIAIYKSGAAQAEVESQQEQKSIFALGGDFYTGGTSDLMRYDSSSTYNQNSAGQFDFTAPSSIKNSELLYPELFIDNGTGLIFSWHSAAFRLFDPQTMSLGSTVKLGDTSTWATSEPIFSNKMLYFAISQYYYYKEEIPPADSKRSEYINEDEYSINTTLKRYDCSAINTPTQLPDISIPGTPKAVFNTNKLITVETNYEYYYYPVDENNSDDITQGIRINSLELGQDNAVLDLTAFFDAESYGNAEVICDQTNIYLTSVKDEQTKIYVIDPNSLNIIASYDLKGTYSPVKAVEGNIVLTSRWYYPYWRYDYVGIMPPYWNSNEIKVVDISGGILKEAASFSNSGLYAAPNNIIIEDEGLYIANGYKGVVYLQLK